MINNYVKLAWRNLIRNKAFSFINIIGLSIGLVTCLLIMLYILDETSYDQHHKDANRLFRIASVTGTGETWAAAPAPLAWALKNDLPEVQQVTRLLAFPEIEKMLLKYEQGAESRRFYESGGYYVDSTFFQVFTYDFAYGNVATALHEPNSLVISDNIAQKFFGTKNAVGKVLLVNTPFGDFNYTVTGVFNSATYKSHINANYFLSMRNNDMWNWVQQQTSWSNTNIFYTYVKLKEGTRPDVFSQHINTFFDRHAGADLKAAGFSKSLFIQPVTGIYLHSHIGGELTANGNITYLYILGSIAAFILLIACINFMNLSTARSQKRAKEVGVRKVMGAERSSLIRQFLGESFVMCLIALVVALLAAWMLLPLFNRLTQKNIHPFNSPVLLLWVVGLTLLTGLLAGLYPAFYLSAFKPVAVLKGKIANRLSATLIRKGLVVFQFTISICLVLAAIVIGQQLSLLQNQHLGFQKSQQVILPLQFESEANKYATLKQELLKNPQIESVTSGSTYPGIPNITTMLFYAEGKSVNDVVDIRLSAIEDNYIETLGFKLLYGRSFSKDFRADSAGIILNEAAVKKLGYQPANAVGKKINYDFGGKHAALQIVGVVKDFNFESLHNPIVPFGFTSELFANKYSYTIARVATNDYPTLLKKIENTWTAINPDLPFLYSFLDQDFARNYEKEQLTASIVGFFTGIAILIACMGLAGLAAFSAEQRIKEIGIRKVLGASVVNVTALLSKDFIKLVLIAILIASPIAWYVMNQWLQDFAYRINISFWMFVAAGLLAIVIAVLTVSFQAIKTALANPVKSLRTE